MLLKDNGSPQIPIKTGVLDSAKDLSASDKVACIGEEGHSGSRSGNQSFAILRLFEFRISKKGGNITSVLNARHLAHIFLI